MIPFIFLSLFIGSAFCSNITIDDCPKGLMKENTKYLKVFGDSCYLFEFNRFKSFTNAQKHCQREGGNLVMIKSQEANNFIMSTLKTIGPNIYSFLWIGLKYQSSVDKYIWLDGTDISFNKIYPGSKYIIASCMAINPSTGEWHKANCENANRYFDDIFPFICQYTPSQITQHPPIEQRVTVDNCPPFLPVENLSVFGNKCYEVVRTKKTYKRSKQYCKERHGQLASLKTEAINEHIRDELVVKHFLYNAWIGLRYDESKHNFVWPDGSVNTYENFYDPRIVNIKHDTCFYLWTLNGNWISSTCTSVRRGTSSVHYSVCEYPATYKKASPTTTTRTTQPPTTTTKATPPPTTTACPSLVCNIDCGLYGYKLDEKTNCQLCECDLD